MRLSKSSEDYLEAIYQLHLGNQKIKSVEISKMLHVSQPGVNKAMKILIDNRLIDKKSYGEIFLTETGIETAKEIYFKHTTIRDFLLQIGVSRTIAEEDCCKIEHVISDETLNKLIQYIKEKK